MITPRIHLLTPTGGRPEAFTLCQKWMARQTYAKYVASWNIVFDTHEDPDNYHLKDEHSSPDFQPHLSIIPIDPRRYIRSGQDLATTHTLNINLNRAFDSALSYVHADPTNPDIFFIIEDDDWYAPNYLETLCNLYLDNDMNFPLMGENPGPYYNVARRRWRVFTNSAHAHLCATAVAYNQGLNLITRSLDLRSHNPSIDLRLWRKYGRSWGKLTNNHDGPPLVVGIKGMPGRPGSTSGHKATVGYHDDPDLTQLIKWIGEEDAQSYCDYYRTPIS